MPSCELGSRTNTSKTYHKLLRFLDFVQILPTERINRTRLEFYLESIVKSTTLSHLAKFTPKRSRQKQTFQMPALSVSVSWLTNIIVGI